VSSQAALFDSKANSEAGQALIEFIGVLLGMGTLITVICGSLAFAAGSMCIEICLQRAVLCRGQNQSRQACEANLRSCLNTVLVAGQLHEASILGSRFSPRARMDWRYEDKFRVSRETYLRSQWSSR